MLIGIPTGGGDVPGLNSRIRAVIDRATERGHEVVGVRRGSSALHDTTPSDPDSVSVTGEGVRGVEINDLSTPLSTGRRYSTSAASPRSSTHRMVWS